jgi:16S rRNA (uracil1498-N3)-methyltransferase
MAQLQRLIITNEQRSGQCIQLSESQQHYLNRVLRLRSGDRFIAMDGEGWWLAVLLSDSSTAEVLEAVSVETELPVAITLLMALPKSGMDDVVRQATEIGVQRIVPILSQRTVLKPSSQKLERWQRIAQEASEQSERQIVPNILPPHSWSDALQTWNSALEPCYLCEARGSYPHLLTRLLPDRPSDSLTLAIGPEGGWTDSEIAEAIRAGYQPVSLGTRILRAVTAPVVALSLLAAVIETQASKLG